LSDYNIFGTLVTPPCRPLNGGFTLFTSPIQCSAANILAWETVKA